MKHYPNLINHDLETENYDQNMNKELEHYWSVFKSVLFINLFATTVFLIDVFVRIVYPIMKNWADRKWKQFKIWFAKRKNQTETVMDN